MSALIYVNIFFLFVGLHLIIISLNLVLFSSASFRFPPPPPPPYYSFPTFYLSLFKPFDKISSQTQKIRKTVFILNSLFYFILFIIKSFRLIQFLIFFLIKSIIYGFSHLFVLAHFPACFLKLSQTRNIELNFVTIEEDFSKTDC